MLAHDLHALRIDWSGGATGLVAVHEQAARLTLAANLYLPNAAPVEARLRKSAVAPTAVLGNCKTS
jgi:hypothetical protein